MNTEKMTMGHHLKSEVSSFEQVQTLPLRCSNSAPAEPCPLGMVLSRKRIGACVALRWSEAQQRYLCGVISDAPTGRLGQLRQWLARRWIAAGVGCDAALVAQFGAEE